MKRFEVIVTSDGGDTVESYQRATIQEAYELAVLESEPHGKRDVQINDLELHLSWDLTSGRP